MSQTSQIHSDLEKSAMIQVSLMGILNSDEIRKREGLLKHFIPHQKSAQLINFRNQLKNEQAFLDFVEEEDREQNDYNADKIDSASRALLYASALGKIGIAENLIKNHGADINYQNEKKETPLLISLKRKRLKMTEWLLENGVNLQQHRQEDEAKKIVCKNGMLSALPILKKYGVNFSTPYTRTLCRFGLFPVYRVKIYPFIVAAFSKQTKLVEELLKTTPLSPDVMGLMTRALQSHSSLTKEIKILFLKALVQGKQNQEMRKQIDKE